MGLRDKLSRGFVAGQKSRAPARTPQTFMAVCTSCLARGERPERDRVPPGWFPFATTDALLCPDCLAPVLDEIDRTHGESNERFLREHPR